MVASTCAVSRTFMPSAQNSAIGHSRREVDLDVYESDSSRFRLLSPRKDGPVAAKPKTNYLAIIECLLAHFAWAFPGGNGKRVACECVG
jgi:hypothetical protein